jgi:hypothetical protein
LIKFFPKACQKAWKERQLAPQASAGYPLSLKSLPVIRKAQRGRDQKASKKWQNPPPLVGRDICLMIASKMAFLLGRWNRRKFWGNPLFGFQRI